MTKRLETLDRSLLSNCKLSNSFVIDIRVVAHNHWRVFLQASSIIIPFYKLHYNIHLLDVFHDNFKTLILLYKP